MHKNLHTALLLLLPLFGLLAAGCESESSRLQTHYTQCATKGISTTAYDMRQDWYAKKITLQAALSMAHERVEKEQSIAAAQFAGAVLEFAAQVKPEIKDTDTTVFLTTRLGTLAANSAAIAWEAQPRDTKLAKALVFAGSPVWGTTEYWMAHPAHDALASYILMENNEGDEALNRLRERPELLDETDRAYREIERELRRRRGR